MPNAYSRKHIQSTITSGSVYYYHEKTHKTSKQHFFIVINIEPSKDTVIFLVCSSTKFKNVLRYRRKCPKQTLVEIKPEQYSEFSEKSIIDCNDVYTKSIEEIASMLSQGKLQEKTVMGLRLVRMLREGVILSNIVENYIKEALRTD